MWHSQWQENKIRLQGSIQWKSEHNRWYQHYVPDTSANNTQQSPLRWPSVRLRWRQTFIVPKISQGVSVQRISALLFNFCLEQTASNLWLVIYCRFKQMLVSCVINPCQITGVFAQWHYIAPSSHKLLGQWSHLRLIVQLAVHTNLFQPLPATSTVWLYMKWLSLNIIKGLICNIYRNLLTLNGTEKNGWAQGLGLGSGFGWDIRRDRD